MEKLKFVVIAALGLGLVVVVSAQGQKVEAAPKEGESAWGMATLGENTQGYMESRNNGDGSTMILIPAGDFTMGSNDQDDEKPIHKVYLATYYIDKYEVTVGQFQTFCSATGRTMPEQLSWNQGDNYPVVSVTWYEASAYASWAGKRLPTEAEWEKAARGTDGRKYPWGDEWDQTKCNADGDADGYKCTAAVGSFPQGASPYGVMDMAGNAWEWCADGYDEDYYQNSPSRDPKGSSSGSFRVVRGGSCFLTQNDCRTSNRDYSTPQNRYSHFGFGFRCAR